MLSKLSYLLFKLKCLQPSENIINLWTHTNQTKSLHEALQNGNYKTRALSAKALGIIGDASSIPFLLNPK